MKKVLKWLGIVVGGLVGLIVVVAIVGTVRANGKLTHDWAYPAESIAIPAGADAVEHGQYLVEHFMLCQDCHGDDLGGKEFFSADDGAGTLWAPNLTGGKGGIGAVYQDADWVRTLRHGIRPNGENLIIMPAEFYTKASAADLGDVIAYLKVLPHVDREIPTRSLAAVPKVLLGLGVIPAEGFLPAFTIDHTAPPLSMPTPGPTAEYGAYRSFICTACHGDDLAGMPFDPDSGIGPTPNLTPGGELAGWSQDDFLQTLRSGITPEGDQLDPEEMPWPRIGGASDDDLIAIWDYLQSLPAMATNN